MKPRHYLALGAIAGALCLPMSGAQAAIALAEFGSHHPLEDLDGVPDGAADDYAGDAPGEFVADSHGSVDPTTGLLAYNIVWNNWHGDVSGGTEGVWDFTFTLLDYELPQEVARTIVQVDSAIGAGISGVGTDSVTVTYSLLADLSASTILATVYFPELAIEAPYSDENEVNPPGLSTFDMQLSSSQALVYDKAMATLDPLVQYDLQRVPAPAAALLLPAALAGFGVLRGRRRG
ncbi:hypothetical protein ACQ5SO_06015 [Rhodovulum sp. DZ06]|uniref:hypothetical protein n=1 Tax=Rhodovulum sp. DZ06 TaxID=3425126 RepID=UPI003D351E37